MADRINVTKAASVLNSLESDFTKINRESTKMLDNLKYLQDNFYDTDADAVTQNYRRISQSVNDSNGLVEILRKVHKWCEKVDDFVEEEEKGIENDRLEEEEEKRRVITYSKSKAG